MCFMFSCRHKSTKGGMLFKLAIGQNLQNEGRALFLPIYLYYICTDLKKKKPKMKENLTSGMPENLEHILFA